MGLRRAMRAWGRPGAAAALAVPALVVLLAVMGLIWLFRSPAQPVPAR